MATDTMDQFDGNNKYEKKCFISPEKKQLFRTKHAIEHENAARPASLLCSHSLLFGTVHTSRQRMAKPSASNISRQLTVIKVSKSQPG